jgi:hypothetical protein
MATAKATYDVVMTIYMAAELGTRPNSRESVESRALSPRRSNEDPTRATQRLSSQPVGIVGSLTTTTSPARTRRQRRTAVNRSPGWYVGAMEFPTTVTRRTKNSSTRDTAKRYSSVLANLQVR